MKEEEIRKKELSAMLTLIYQQGFAREHPRLFDIDEPIKKGKETKEAIRFHNLIKEEAAIRKIKPLELIQYFADNRKELLNLLEKKDTGLVKFTRIYEHAEMEKLKSQILKPGRLEKSGKALLNEEYIKGEVEVWKNKDVEYYVKVNDLLKLGGKDPKVFVSQLKNISLLLALIQEQQFNNETKEAECEFALSYYAERRGYSKRELKKGGKFYEELKKDLFTGAYTTYRIDKVVINGNEYVAHGIPNFYILLEPVKDHPGINWIVKFNEPWKSWTTEILNGEAPRFFIKDSKAIEDRHTTERPYLFLFYMQLVKRKRNNLLTTPVKIINLLKDMKLPEKILIRPKECFKVLMECLTYFNENYQPTPEIESINIYSDFHKRKATRLPLSISETFKGYKYKDFKELLISMGIKDIREAYISFKRPYKNPRKKFNLNEEETAMLNRTLKWFDGQITRIPPADQESLIKMYIKKLGHDNYKELFEYEANKLEANAVEFLTKVLPGKIRAKKTTYT